MTYFADNPKILILIISIATILYFTSLIYINRFSLRIWRHKMFVKIFSHSVKQENERRAKEMEYYAGQSK